MGDVERIAERAGLRLLRVVVTLAVVLLMGCATGPGGSAPPPSPDVVAAAPAQKVASSTVRPATSLPSSPVTDVVYTAADQEIAELMTAAAGQAIPVFKGLNVMDPSHLEDLGKPLGTWIADSSAPPSRRTPRATARRWPWRGSSKAWTPTTTSGSLFLAWRDWGAHGDAFHPEAARQAAVLLEDALVELEAHCAT